MRSFRSWLPNWSYTLRAKFVGEAAACAIPGVPHAWRDLYVAALFESDRMRTPQRIAEAKKALVTRARELFQATGDHVQEQTAIDDALQALHAREHCKVHPSGSRH